MPLRALSLCLPWAALVACGGAHHTLPAAPPRGAPVEADGADAVSTTTMSDTTPDAARFDHERLRALPAAERLRIAASLSASVRRLAEAGVRLRFPGIGERELAARLAARLYGDAVASRWWLLFMKAPPESEVEPTNNRVERGLRPAAIDRRRMQQNRDMRGVYRDVVTRTVATTSRGGATRIAPSPTVRVARPSVGSRSPHRARGHLPRAHERAASAPTPRRLCTAPPPPVLRAPSPVHRPPAACASRPVACAASPRHRDCSTGWGRDA